MQGKLFSTLILSGKFFIIAWFSLLFENSARKKTLALVKSICSWKALLIRGIRPTVPSPLYHISVKRMGHVGWGSRPKGKFSSFRKIRESCRRGGHTGLIPLMFWSIFYVNFEYFQKLSMKTVSQNHPQPKSFYVGDSAVNEPQEDMF